MRSSFSLDAEKRLYVRNSEEVARYLKAGRLGLPLEEALEAQIASSQLKPASTRVVRRCVVTGRGRGVLRRFRRSRIVVRQAALNGELAGVRKWSW